MFGEFYRPIVWNGHYACTCYHPLFVFNQFGDLERCTLRPGKARARIEQAVGKLKRFSVSHFDARRRRRITSRSSRLLSASS
jgi:Transposase DDE domain group 1